MESDAVLKAFQRFDADGDGTISADELSACLLRLGADAWEAGDLELLLDTVDTNNDGVISYREFLAWISRADAPLGGSEGEGAVSPKPKEQPASPNSRKQPLPKVNPASPKAHRQKSAIVNTATQNSVRNFHRENGHADDEDDEVCEEDEADDDDEDEDEEEDEDANDDDEEDCDSNATEREEVMQGVRKDVWRCLMPAQRGSALAAAEAMSALPPPDEKNPDDARHVELYLRHFPDGDLDGDRDLEDGEAPKGAEREPALRWLHAALDRLDDGDKRYSLPIKWLLGNFRLWPESDNEDEEGFVLLKSFAEEKLDAIGIRYEEDVFIARGLDAELGDLGADVVPSRPRQDAYLPLPDALKEGKFCQDDVGRAYIALLLTAVHALDPRFQEAAKEVCDAEGGACGAPPPKGFMRMMAKMVTDHCSARPPKPAENIDTNRVAWTFDEPCQLKAAFARASAAFGPPLRVKNGYSSLFDSLKVSKGYRNILANYRFDSGCTWGELSCDPRTVTAWEQLRATTLGNFQRLGFIDEDSLTDEFRSILVDLDEAREHLSSSTFQANRAVLVVEVQYMLRPYLEMRKYTHSWYKIVRAENAEGLVLDFNA